MACDLDPSMRRTPALEILNDRLVEASRTPRAKLLLSFAPQEGKSTLIGRWFPIWLLWLNRRRRIVYATYDLGLSRTIQGQTRDAVRQHADRLGMALNKSYTAKQEWVLAEGGGVLSAGIGTGLSGRPADVLLVDDAFKGAREAASPTQRENVKLWWQSVASARLAPGAPVIVLGTRYSEDDLIGWLHSQQEGEQWEYLNIPAQADHDPEKGETDVLGREPGEYMVSARGRTKEEWDQRKINAGSRQWAAMYQGRPSPAEGSILKRAWWERNYYRDLPYVVRSDGTRWVVDEGAELIITVDCAFKGEDNRRITNGRAQKDRDYVSMQVWMRRGVHVYLLDQVHGHMDFVETSQALLSLSAQWPQAALKVVEEAANGPAVMAALRNQLGGIVGEIPQGSKESRANATAPYLEAGNIHIPDPSVEGMAWVADFVEEAASFPYAKHDDRVDTYTMAVNRLLIQPLEGEVPDMRSEEERWADLNGWTVSPY